MKISDILAGKPLSKTDASITASLKRSLLFPLLLMALLCLLAVYQTHRLLSLSNWIEHTDQAITLIQGAEKNSANLESGMRGYLLTGEKSFLAPFEDAKIKLSRQLDVLGDLTAGNQAQTERIGKLRELIAKWNDHAGIMIDRKENGKDIVALVKSQFAKKYMDQARATYAEMNRAEQALRAQRKAKVEQDVRRTTLGALILSLFWGTILAIGARKQLLKVSATYDGVVSELATYQAELERRVQERTAALMASNAELESFCYSVSHDLRAPLRGIDGFSQALVEDYSSVLDPTAKRYLNFVRDGVQKMGKLIDDLLDLSRLSRIDMKKQSVDLGTLAQDIIDQLRKQEPARQVAFKNLPAEEAWVEGDSGLLSAMLQNLIGNAWKFTSKKSDGQIEFGWDGASDNPSFYVKDNGAGFDMSFESKLFGAFQRLHSPNEFKGTGVGLATVRRIVRRHGGEVWAKGEVGQGATFYFTLSRKDLTHDTSKSNFTG